MKAYIVTLFNLPESVKVAERAAESCRKFGLGPVFWPGVWRDDAMMELAKEGLKVGTFDESWSNTAAAVGNFVAQCRLWKLIAATEPAIIMEHDAVVVAPIPPMGASTADIVSLGKPSFGKLKKPEGKDRFFPLFSCGDKIPGAHGYYLTPCGAQQLIDKAREIGALPVDKFISPQRFEIDEYYPWPIEAHDSFTTIQRVKGCRSKHNWNRWYKIF